KPFDDGLIKTDDTGRIFGHDAVKSTLVVMRGATVEKRIPLPEGAQPVAISGDGTLVATQVGQEIVMVDDSGAEKWRASVWGGGALGFIGGGKRLAVQAPGGFVALDATTGERVARECAWNFGLHDKQPDPMNVAQTSVCEDPVVQ